MTRADQAPEHEIIGFFGHGPFRNEPVAGDLMERIKYRIERIGSDDLLPAIQKFFGCIAVHREPVSTKVIDFTRLGFKGHQPPLVVKVMRYYFDDLAAALFEASGGSI
jgi:hypothetical protein